MELNKDSVVQRDLLSLFEERQASVAGEALLVCEDAIELCDDIDEVIHHHATMRIRNLPDDLPVVINTHDDLRVYANIRKTLEDYPDTSLCETAD